jgi:hypothetical protein
MSAMKEEIVRSRAESADLRREMEATRSLLAAQTKPGSTSSDYSGVGGQKNLGNPPRHPHRVPIKIPKYLKKPTARQRKGRNFTRPKSRGSKYRVRLSGIVLLNAVENRGAVDNLDFPSLAIPSGPGSPKGSFGATLRQSLLGLEVFGPEIHGARISGDVQFDFAGSSYNLSNGTTFGFARLRTGGVRLNGQTLR